MGVAELALWTPDYYLAHPSPSAWLAALGGLSLRLAGRRARTQPVPAAGAVPLRPPGPSPQAARQVRVTDLTEYTVGFKLQADRGYAGPSPKTCQNSQYLKKKYQKILRQTREARNTQTS